MAYSLWLIMAQEKLKLLIFQALTIRCSPLAIRYLLYAMGYQP
jgi:hypothetical protein